MPAFSRGSRGQRVELVLDPTGTGVSLAAYGDHDHGDRWQERRYRGD